MQQSYVSFEPSKVGPWKEKLRDEEFVNLSVDSLQPNPLHVYPYYNWYVYVPVFTLIIIDIYPFLIQLNMSQSSPTARGYTTLALGLSNVNLIVVHWAREAYVKLR